MLKKKFSAVELKAAAYLEPLGWIHCNTQFFPISFPHPTIHGATFRAKPDFYHPVYDAYIETKCSSLNTMRSPQDAERRYNDSFAVAGMKKDLDFGWNHAATKQSIVQQVLSPWKFTVVFVNGLDDKMKKRVIKYGVHCYTSLRHLEGWLHNLHLLSTQNAVRAAMTKAYNINYVPKIGAPLAH